MHVTLSKGSKGKGVSSHPGVQMGAFTQSGRLQILFVKGERRGAEGRRGTMQ